MHGVQGQIGTAQALKARTAALCTEGQWELKGCSRARSPLAHMESTHAHTPRPPDNTSFVPQEERRGSIDYLEPAKNTAAGAREMAREHWLLFQST